MRADGGLPRRHGAARRRRAAAGRYLLFVGAGEPRKALGVLTAAHVSAQARGLDAELVVVGDGLRRVDDAELAALYAGALAVVAPSYLEGFGLAAAGGRRPRHARRGQRPALLRRDAGRRRAARAASATPARWPTRCCASRGDDALRARLGAAARERAALYTWERAAAALHPLLAEAARVSFTIVTVLHDSAPELAPLLPSVREHLPADTQLVAVDSGSRDDGAALARGRRRRGDRARRPTSASGPPATPAWRGRATT